MVWYPILFDANRGGIEGDRFLHCGETSARCITVIDVKHWTKLDNYLYDRRLRDSLVGTIAINSQYVG